MHPKGVAKAALGPSPGPPAYRWTALVVALILLHGFSRRVLREDYYNEDDASEGTGGRFFPRRRHHHRRRHRPHPGNKLEPTSPEGDLIDATSDPLIQGTIAQPPFTSSHAPSNAQEEAWQASKALRVRLQVFVEALCVDSQRFVLEELVPAYGLLTDQVVELELIVFGNAHLAGNNDDMASSSSLRGIRSLTCQHGPAECDANSYEQCAIHVLSEGDGGPAIADPAQASLAYVACLFTDLDMGYRDQNFDPQVFAACASTPELAFRIRACHDDPRLSLELQRQAAKATPNSHTHVPWILINGRHTYDPLEDNDDDDPASPSYAKLVKAICQAHEASGGSDDDIPACR